MNNELQHYEPQQSLQVQVRPDRLSINDLQEQVALIGKMMESVLKTEVHYGVIPGVKKPFLFKAGAEKLSTVFRLSPSYTVIRNDLDGGHREYEVTCAMTHIPTGVVWGEGVGSCSTMEKKYRYRWVNGVNVENSDLADTYNTVLKMAKKRAHVDATLSATACSDFFTQDEDYVEASKDSQRQSQAPKTRTPDEVVKEAEQVFDGKEVTGKPATTKFLQKPGCISEGQNGMLYALCVKAKLDVKEFIGRYKYQHTRDIKWQDFKKMKEELDAILAQSKPTQDDIPL